MKRRLFLWLAPVFLVIAGCGGSSSGSAPKILSGVFKDSNVKGLSYVSGSQKGVTDLKGTFRYEDGSQIAFNVGGIELGSALGKSIITPVDLVSNGNLASSEVINRVRFLMMLDKNNLPSDGIEISTNVQNAISKLSQEQKNLDFSLENFSTDEKVINIRVEASAADSASGSVVNHVFPSREDAVKHLKTTLLCSYAGGFTGNYSGDENGHVAFMVNPGSGNLTGSSYNSSSQVSVEIGSDSPIDYDKALEFVSSEDSGKLFNGKFTSPDALGGNWADSLDATRKGSFSALRLGGASDAIYRYAATFTGSGKGIFTFDVDAGNNVKIKVYNVASATTQDMTGTLTNKTDLKAEVPNGLKINAVVNELDNSIQGVWTNLKELKTGTLAGSGCKLN